MPLQPVTYTVASGTRTIDAEASHIGFEVATLQGLAKVKGTFERFHGTLVGGTDEIDAHLWIDAASLNTGNKRRDAHFRSADFFNVARYPEITFDASAVAPTDAGLAITGTLMIGDSRVALELPVDVHNDDDRLVLRTSASLSRDAAGLGWNRIGVIRGDAVLHVELVVAQAS